MLYISPKHVPLLNEAGRIDLFILQLMAGVLSNEEIAREAQRHFPRFFPRQEDALARVRSLALNRCKSSDGLNQG
jgi:hypothetical protein